jgi:glycerophosphoryl diester phosphodiesterase
MKRTVVFLVVSLCYLVASAQTLNFNKNCVVAHRGAWKEKGLPQNSIASWREAVRLGCHGSECDVHITADDSLVVTHDLKHHGLPIKESKYADLMKYPLKNGEKMPTFREYLAEVKRQNTTKLIIDVKTMISDEYSLRLSREIIRVIEEMEAMPWCEFLGSNIKALQYIQKTTGRRVAYLGKWREELPEMNPDVVRDNGFVAVDYQNIFYFAHPEWIKTFKKHKVHLNAWTINKEEDMDWFIKHKFDYITTDHPSKLLDKLGYRR